MEKIKTANSHLEQVIQNTSTKATVDSSDDLVSQSDTISIDTVATQVDTSGLLNQTAGTIETLNDKLGSWWDVLILNIPNIVIAIVIFLGAYFLSRKMNLWIHKLLRKRVRQATIRDLISNIASITIIAIGIFLVLAVLNLDKALTSILAGAGVAGLAVGLALQGALSNTFSGIFLAVRDIIDIGDYVETNGYSGTVESINLRFIKLKEPDNNIVVIPNKLVVENPFKNFGLTQRIRTTIHCGVSYDSDLEFVKKVASETIENLFPQKNNERIEFQYLEFGGSSINFQMRFWVEATANLTLLESKSEAIIALKKRFDQEEIDIPFPIRTIKMDNAIKLAESSK